MGLSCKAFLREAIPFCRCHTGKIYTCLRLRYWRVSYRVSYFNKLCCSLKYLLMVMCLLLTLIFLLFTLLGLLTVLVTIRFLIICITVFCNCCCKFGMSGVSLMTYNSLISLHMTKTSYLNFILFFFSLDTENLSLKIIIGNVHDFEHLIKRQCF